METSRRYQAQNDLGYNFEEEDSKYSQALEKEERRREKKQRKREELLESSSYRMVSGIAKYWDNCFLDPIVGLFLPGFGDFITTTLGLPAIWMSLTKIRSLPLTLAVIYNLVVDMLIGLIPFYIGDICDAFNKANKKNMKLIVGFIEDDEEIISKVNRKAVFFGIMIIVLCFIIYYAIKFVISMATGMWDYISGIIA